MGKKKSRLATIVVFLALLVVVGYSVASISVRNPMLGWVAPGWEIYDAIGGVGYQGKVLSTVNSFVPYTDTSPDIGGTFWSFDLSPEHAANNGHSNLDYGIPTITISLGDIHHVDFTGNDIPDNQAAATLNPITIGNQTYYLDEHIYIYTVTVRTYADVSHIYDRSIGLRSIPDFAHETSYPYEALGPPISGGPQGTTWVGKPFVGDIYTKLVISPWEGGVSLREPPNSSYTLTGAWAGIMNAYILPGSLQEGMVQNEYPTGNPTPDPSAEPVVKCGLSSGDQVDMFADDGTFANTVAPIQWDTSLTPTTRVPSTVDLKFPILNMEAGAHLYLNEFGVMDSITPLDVAVQYTLRVDVLMTHQFTLQTAINPPTPSWPKDYFGWSESFWQSVLGSIDPFSMFGPFEPFVWFLFTLFIIGLVVLVLVAVFAPWAIPRLTGSLRSGYDALKGKKKG